jgi:hypothetical protein
LLPLPFSFCELCKKPFRIAKDAQIIKLNIKSQPQNITEPQQKIIEQEQARSGVSKEIQPVPADQNYQNVASQTAAINIVPSSDDDAKKWEDQQRVNIELIKKLGFLQKHCEGINQILRDEKKDYIKLTQIVMDQKEKLKSKDNVMNEIQRKIEALEINLTSFVMDDQNFCNCIDSHDHSTPDETKE